MSTAEETVVLTSIPERRRCWVLFYEFCKISTFVVGGGLVIIPAAQNVFGRQRHWVDEDKMVDLVALTQSVPGILACNAAIFIGYHVAGFRGALSALIGSVLPPFLIISLIASGLTAIGTSHPWVQGAFTGTISCVTGMVLAMVIRTGKRTQRSVFAWCVGLGCFVGMVYFNLNPAWLILASVAAGIAYTGWVLRRGGVRK